MKRLSFSKKTGFTLAEVLVTLGIIGVVAALTIPTLMNNNQRAVLTTQLRKVATELNLALTKYMSDQRVESLAETQLANNTTYFDRFVENYLKSKTCLSLSECFASSYYTISGNTGNFSPTCDAVFKLASGASICGQVDAITNSHDTGTVSGGDVKKPVSMLTDHVIVVTVDVNGKQGPNVFGRDLFTFQVDSRNELQDIYYILHKKFDDTLVDSSNGAFGKIVEDGWQMTY